MDPFVFVAVLFAAALHAVWNAMVKHTGDKLASMAAVSIGHLPLALLALFLAPAPAPESWPYIAVSVLLHVGYQVFLVFAYRIGDLTQVYPIARGAAPMIVAGVSMLLLGVHLSATETLSVALIGIGIMSLVLVRRSDGMRNPRAALLALATGGFIAAYSLVDGLGARLAGDAFGYCAWLMIGSAGVFSLSLAVLRPAVLIRTFARERRTMLLGGGASFAAYAVVIWAFTQAPIALVTALRETSIVFALIIGVGFLKERLNLAKLVSTAVTLSGAILLRVSR